MENYVNSLLMEKFLSEYNRKPFGKNINGVISNWCSKIETIAENHKIEATILAEKALDNIIKVHKKSRNFVPSINVLLGNKYLDMIRNQITRRNLGITKTERLILDKNIKPLVLLKESTINLIARNKFIKNNSNIRILAHTAFEETFLGNKITTLTNIPTKPIKGNFEWETVTLLMHIKKAHNEIPVTRRIITIVEAVLFSILLHNHKEELKKIYIQDYEYTPEYANDNTLKVLLDLWEECRDKINKKDVNKYVRKQSVIDDIVYFLGFKPVTVPLRKFGTAIDVKYSYSYCILLMKAFTLAMNQILFKGKTSLEPFLSKIAYIYDCNSIKEVLSVNSYIYDKVSQQKTGNILKKYNHYIKEKVFFLLERTTSKTKIHAINRKARKEIEKNLIPHIKLKGLRNTNYKVVTTLMKQYKIPHINPTNI